MRLSTILIVLTATFCMATATGQASEKANRWTDPVTGMVFVWVPQGCYKMGDTFGEQPSDEKPVHEVCVDGFWLGQTPVTQGQWKTVMGENTCLLYTSRRG